MQRPPRALRLRRRRTPRPGRRGPAWSRAPRRAPGRGRHRAGVPALSARELEVARLVADGLSNKEIAARLFLSEKTIETHLTRAFTKVGVTRRAALASRIAAERARA